MLGSLYQNLELLGLLWWLNGKESACNAEGLGLIPGSGRSPGEGNGYPLHCSSLENPKDRGAWRATVHGVAESETTKRLSGASLVTQGKELACNAEDLGSIPGSGRSPGGGNGNPHQDSCLENSMDRGAWQATVHGVSESDTTKRPTLSLFLQKTVI